MVVACIIKEVVSKDKIETLLLVPSCLHLVPMCELLHLSLDYNSCISTQQYSI